MEETTEQPGNRNTGRQRNSSTFKQPGFSQHGPLSKNNLRKLSKCRLAYHGTGQVEDILSFDARAYRREPESLRWGNDGRLKNLGKFEPSQGGYTIENPYKFERKRCFNPTQHGTDSEIFSFFTL